ncbi:polygalacturonase 5, partial [Genlisea aurea]
SIGSLGRERNEAGVKNVTVKTATFTGTENGVRVKTWARPTNGFVDGVKFQDALMVNVDNPIIIDQHYCPNNEDCPRQVSGVRIKNVRYENIYGTSANQVAIKLNCSKKFPCSGIELDDVNLTYGQKPAVASCANAVGKNSGNVVPDGCF